MIARINLIEIIVSGVNSSKRNLVAIKEAPQNKTANIGNKYLYDFVLI
jgi:hypothetical protein